MSLYIEDFIWREWVIEKIVAKHRIEPWEVEQALFNEPYKLRRVEEGKSRFYGRTDAGRYLFIVFAWEGYRVRVVTARDMTADERRYFARK